MKFFAKLLGKEASPGERSADQAVEEAFPTDDAEDLTFAAFEPGFDQGYETALGSCSVAAPEVSVTDSGLSSDDDPFQEDDTSWPSLPANLSDSGEAPLLSYVAEGPGSEWAGLRMRLQADPRSADAHAAVRRAISLREDRIDFYQELVDTYPEEVYHYLSLARAYRAAGQEREAIPHYQRYLRSRLEAEALDELAEVYSLVGERYLAESSRQIAQSLRSKGGSCSSS